jgi:hypothetical protein
MKRQEAEIQIVNNVAQAKREYFVALFQSHFTYFRPD